jgi:hypothetical protein
MDEPTATVEAKRLVEECRSGDGGLDELRATEKSSGMEAFITSMYGPRSLTLALGQCLLCKQDADNFRDDKSLKEYQISGMCQACQDATFGV